MRQMGKNKNVSPVLVTGGDIRKSKNISAVSVTHGCSNLFE
jgi:hypothetical protein